MDTLTHYIVVRRDLDIGDVVAQVAHAAGESFFGYAQVAQAEQHIEGRNTDDVGDAESIPALGSVHFRKMWLICPWCGKLGHRCDHGQFPGSSDVERRESGDAASQAALGANSSIAQTVERVAVNHDVAGSSPARGANFDPTRTIAIVLGARNEYRLTKLENVLKAIGIQHSAIRETEGKYAGQLMAIGLFPDIKEKVLSKVPYLNEFHMFQPNSRYSPWMGFLR